MTIFPARVAAVDIGMRQPFVPYQRNVLDVVEETFPRKEDVMFRERLMEETELDDEDTGEPEKNVSEKGVETILEEMEEGGDETKEIIDEEEKEEEKEEVEEEEKEEVEEEMKEDEEEK